MGDWSVQPGMRLLLMQPPWMLVVEAWTGRVALETLQERVEVISGAKEELCHLV